MLRWGLALGLLSACAAVTAAGATSAERRPRLAITDPAPLTVQGAGFFAQERVTVTATVRATRTKWIVANARGRFTVRFLAMSVLGYCPRYTIKATGNRGNRATIKVTSVCPPPGPTD